MNRLVLTLFALSVMTVVTPADEAALLRRIDALEARVKDLENQLGVGRAEPVPPGPGLVGAPSTADNATDLVARVEKLEKQATEEAKPNDFRFYWKDGLRFDTRDGTVKMRLSGRMHNDWGWASQGRGSKAALGDVEDGVEFRRLWLGVSGTLYDDVLFSMMFDFAAGNANLKDAYVGMQNVPAVGTLLIGHMKEPFSLEEMTSTNYLTFLEHGLPHVFAPSRNVGVRANSTCFDERVTWAVGAFRDADDTGMHLADDGYSATGRVTMLPIYTDEGRRLVHVGAAYSHRQPEDDTVRYRERPEYHNSQRFVDTANFVSRSQDLLGLEAAAVYGPVSLQAEYMRLWADRQPPNRDAQFDGFYFQASWLVTGEHRPYDRKNGVFSRVKPRRDFRLKQQGWGAWELAARYSCLDLNDAGIAGGEMDDYTFGLNWYLNPNVRMTFNYIHSDVRGAGEADLFGGRVQVDF